MKTIEKMNVKANAIALIGLALVSMNLKTLAQEATFSGNASWYGIPFHGKKTASGEIFDMNKLTSAHKTLPLLTKVLVENPKNGKSAVVKVNDRGPYVKTRVMDLSRKGADNLGYLSHGTAHLDFTVIGKSGKGAPPDSSKDDDSSKKEGAESSKKQSTMPDSPKRDASGKDSSAKESSAKDSSTKDNAKDSANKGKDSSTKGKDSSSQESSSRESSKKDSAASDSAKSDTADSPKAKKGEVHKLLNKLHKSKSDSTKSDTSK